VRAHGCTRRDGCWLLLSAAGLLTGCEVGNEPVRLLRDEATTANSLASTMETVRNPASARTAVPKLEADFARLIRILNRAAEMMQKNQQMRVSESELQRATHELEEATKRLKAAFQRVGTAPGLPLEFWTVVQLLGDVGTASAFPMLRRALQSRNPMVQSAAKSAIQQIRQHASAKTAGGKAA
jgi:HEAT repeat protein